MAQIIKNMGQFATALESKMRETLELVAEDVKREIDDTLHRYYDEYDPTLFYQRTDQLRNCCKIGKFKTIGDTVSVEIFLDIDSLNYKSPGANAYKTVVAANAGLHGGWDTPNLATGQVAWGSISGNDGTKWGSGTQIWEEPMRELIDNGKLVTTFKKHAKARGLNIK